MRTLKRIISLLLCAALLLPGAAEVLRARAVQVYTLQPGVFTEVTIETLGETVYYSFTPEADGRYRLYSVADRDVEAELFNGNMEYICYNDDGGEDQNFCLEYDLSAGQTYYYGVFFHQCSVGSFQIRLVELTCSGVKAASKTGRTNYMAPVGGGVTLGVDASSGMGDVTLRWYSKTADKLTLLEGETADTFTVDGLTEGDWLWVCRAADAFGSHVDVTFFVACATPQVLTANSAATITVETVSRVKYLAFTPEVTGTYRLYSVAEKDVTADLYDAQMDRIGHNDDGGEGQNFCLDHVLTAGETYYYAVSFYHADTGSFSVNLLHLTAEGLLAKAKDDKTMFLVPFGGSVTLTVEASSGLGPVAYRWYRYNGDDYILLEGENAASLTLSDLTSGGQWRCRVTDDHGSCSDIDFYIDCASPQPLTLDTAFAVTVETAGQTVYFSFTPEVTANYCFYSASDGDVTAELYDEDMRHIGHDDDSGEDQNFVLNHTLEAGETYYYSARYYHGDTGSFTVYLIRPAENGFSADRVSQEFAFIHPGDSVTMEVTAACDDGVLHYHWRSQTEDKNIEGANGPSFTSPPAERGEVYLCIVTDNHGNRAEIRFELVNLDAITYTWAEDLKTCTATYTYCTPTLIETAGVESYCTATCTEDGVTVYTAAFTNPRFSAQEKKEETPHFGHAYGEPVYVWNEDLSECTAMVVCANDESHVISETAKTQYEVTLKPTCTEPGVGVYTAAFNNKRFYGQVKEVEIPASGHAYGEPVYVWSEDYRECTAMVICANDESHVISETAQSEAEIKPATCTEPGLAVYTVGFNNKRFWGQRKEVEIPAAGHDYGEPVYVWSEDLSECTATVICANDATHVISETAKSEVQTKPATCTEPGLAVYTAGFNNKRFWGQRKEVEIPALGHDLISHEAQAPTCTEPGWNAYETCSRCDYTSCQVIPAGHTPGEPVRENETDTAYDEVVYCTVCGEELSRNTVSLVAVLPGDVDGDGKVTAGDARLALRRAVDLEDYAEGSPEFIACDIDKDGKVTAGDARIILRIAVDLESVEDYR